MFRPDIWQWGHRHKRHRWDCGKTSHVPIRHFRRRLRWPIPASPIRPMNPDALGIIPRRLVNTAILVSTRAQHINPLGMAVPTRSLSHQSSLALLESRGLRDRQIFRCHFRAPRCPPPTNYRSRFRCSHIGEPTRE